MMPSEVARKSTSSQWRLFGKGALPIVIVCLLVWAMGETDAGPIAIVAGNFVCGIVLWLGWSAIRLTLATRWLGRFLAFLIGLFLVLFALAIGYRLLMISLPLLAPAGRLFSLFFVFLVLALPFLVYDLLFRAPFEGRYARVRAERRHLRSQL